MMQRSPSLTSMTRILRSMKTSKTRLHMLPAFSVSEYKLKEPANSAHWSPQGPRSYTSFSFSQRSVAHSDSRYRRTRRTCCSLEGSQPRCCFRCVYGDGSDGSIHRPITTACSHRSVRMRGICLSIDCCGRNLHRTRRIVETKPAPTRSTRVPGEPQSYPRS